ncbi:GIY-YIG nuclease family protein [Tessaracoccus sp. G1721]
MTASDLHVAALLAPARLTSRAEALARSTPLPAQSGVYAWYFDAPPPGVPTDGVHSSEFGHLFYVGIAPREQRRSDSRPSKQDLRKRIRNHFRGNASGSTLRLTLGSLLAGELGLQLRRVGNAERLTFGDGEAALSSWMAEHARVCWYVDPTPWAIESELLSEFVLPLNLDQNRHGGFHATLSASRHAQRQAARSLPVLP